MAWSLSPSAAGKLFVVGLGITFLSSVPALLWLLEQVRKKGEIQPPQPKTQYITQETEDALKLGTLETLLGHYNYAIRETSAKIVCDRAVNDGSTLMVLLYGITREDYDERMRNLRCLAIITDHHTLKLLHTWKAYAAIVRSLELCLDPDQEPLDDQYFDEYYLRDMAEKLCLMFISQLVTRFDAKKLIKARFVEKWLAKQNWGTTPEERQRNFAYYVANKSNRITDIVLRIKETSGGRAVLEKAGLLARGTRRNGDLSENHTGSFSLILSLRVENDEGEVNPRRSLEQSPEEQRLRHRHREAMVLNDGTRPLNSEDIIQRDPGSPT